MRAFLIADPDPPTYMTLDMEGKTDGEQIDDEYPYWTFSADFWRIETDEARNGSQSSSLFFTKVAAKTGTFAIQTIDRSHMMTGEFWVMAPVAFDDVQDAVILDLYIYSSTASAQVRVQMRDEIGATNYISVQSRDHEGGYHAVKAGGNWPVDTWFGIKVVADITAGWAKFYYDATDSGTWTWGYTETWVVTGETYWENAKVVTSANVNSDDFNYDEVYLDDLKITPGPVSGDEITGIQVGAIASKRLAGMGATTFKVRDYALANYSTYKDYIWPRIEMWKDDMSLKLGEYFIIEPEFEYNHVTFKGPEALRVLDSVNAGYNSILASGELTDIDDDDTPPTVTDANAAFTAGMVGKVCLFTDDQGPTRETAYPAASSDHYKTIDDGVATLFDESGDYTDLATEDIDDAWHAVWNSTVATQMFYNQIEFATTNGASALDFDLNIKFLLYQTYTTAPSLHFYDFTNTTWRKVTDLTIGTPGAEVVIQFNFDETNIPAGVISDYFSGDANPEFHIKIISGETASTDEYLDINFFFAELIFTHANLIQLSNYVIDAQTATTLTFTGQTPYADGIRAGDRYIVCDYIHINLEAIFNNAYRAGLTLDVEASTLAEGSDYRTGMIGHALRQLARLIDREYYQILGWTVQCIDSSNYVSTGYTIGDEDLVPNPKLEGWKYKRSGQNIVRHVQVVGGGAFAEGYQTPTYNSPQTFVVNDKRIASQQTAEDLVTSTLADKAGPKGLITFTVDTDGAAPTGGDDYSLLDVGKTITVDIYGSTIQITNGRINDIVYTQKGKDHLLAELVVEEI